MQTNRRNFLKLGLAGTSAALLHQLVSVEKAIASPSESDPQIKKKAALFDVTKCVDAVLAKTPVNNIIICLRIIMD
jgi:hypothetical protein